MSKKPRKSKAADKQRQGPPVEETARKLAETFACETAPDLTDEEVTSLVAELDRRGLTPQEPDVEQARESALLGLAATYAAMRSAAGVQNLVLDFFRRHRGDASLAGAWDGEEADAQAAAEQVHRLLVGVSQGLERSIPYAMLRRQAEPESPGCRVALDPGDGTGNETYRWEHDEAATNPLPIRPVVLHAAKHLAGMPDPLAQAATGLVLKDLFRNAACVLPHFTRVGKADGSRVTLTWIPTTIKVGEEELQQAEEVLRSEWRAAVGERTEEAGQLPLVPAGEGIFIHAGSTIAVGSGTLFGDFLHSLPDPAPGEYRIAAMKKLSATNIEKKEIPGIFKTQQGGGMNPSAGTRGGIKRPEETA